MKIPPATSAFWPWLRRSVTAVAALLCVWLLACYSLFTNPPVFDADYVAGVQADAVVVLAGDSSERLPVGQELVAAELAPVLVMSNTDTPGNVDADKLCRRPAHVSRVCFEPDPRTTRGEARALARLAADRGWDTMIVVTSDYHALRAFTNLSQCSTSTLIMVPSEPDHGLLGWLPRFVEESAALAATHLRPVCANRI
ncbi:YdcF family protein [Arthrobacter sp. CAN_A1]|uniref:YdcF family protein n=1 Tax=Arthrobacter sp. CAN_A1 TaxID=2787717 RepID=UPI001A32606A